MFSGDAIANDVLYHNHCWATVKKKAEAPRKAVYWNKEIIHTVSEIELVNLIESELNDPSHQILGINSIANKEKNLVGHLWAQRAQSELGGAPSIGGIREWSPLLILFRLCVGLEWLKIGLNGNVFWFFSWMYNVLLNISSYHNNFFIRQLEW